MIGAIGTDSTMRLAFLELDQDSNEEKAATSAISDARKQAVAAQNEEVEKMHAGAHDMRVGAAISSSLTVAGSVAGAAGAMTGPATSTLKASTTSTLLSGSGSVLSGLAKPLGQYFGDSAKADHDADALAARGAASQAQWRADDAASTRDKLIKHDDRTESTLTAIESDKNAGRNALIGNLRG